MTFIDEHSGLFAVALLLRVLGIAESTYYAWKKLVVWLVVGAVMGEVAEGGELGLDPVQS